MKPDLHAALPQWPPLIPASRAPWLARVRDVVLTVLAWLLLIWLMHGLLLVLLEVVDLQLAESIGSWLGTHLGPLFGEVVLPPPGAFWEDFKFFVYTAGVFVAWLTAWGAWNRKKLQLQAPEAGVAPEPGNVVPPVLQSQEQFARVGISDPPPAVWQQSRQLRVSFDAEGSVTSASSIVPLS